MNIIIFLLLMTGIAQADIFVVYDPQTKEVDSLSNANDAVIPAGHEVKQIPGEVEEYYASADAKDYKFNGSKLSLNVKKMNDREVAFNQKKQAKAAVKDSATAKLKALNFTDDEINLLIK